MPPDETNTAVGNTSSSEATAVSASASSSSYWDAPAEKNLEGKRLSQLDLSSLNHQRATTSDEENTDDKKEAQGTSVVETEISATLTENGSYWDTPTEKGLHGQRLSNMDLTTLTTQHLDDDRNSNNKTTVNSSKRNSIGSYWDWQGEQFKKTLSSLSLSNLTKGSRGAGAAAGAAEEEENCNNNNITNDESSPAESSGMGPRRPSNNSYWFWRNASMNNLNRSNLSLTSLERATKNDDAAEQLGTADSMPQRRNSNGGSSKSYWLWRNNSMKDMSMSTTSLETLDKKARESEGSAAVSVVVEESGGNRGPITNLQHKMRNSWRKSFQHFSTNSLSKLDEGSTVGANKQGWKDAFTGRKLQLDNDDSLGGVSACSNGSNGDGAITF
jgi:hypothetical protein